MAQRLQAIQSQSKEAGFIFGQSVGLGGAAKRQVIVIR